MESEGCLIVNRNSMKSDVKRELIENLRALFQMGLTAQKTKIV